MAKKRGGLAGIWDRNKKIIKPVATGLAGLIGTPALGAAVGAAMGGLDRPGKSGIGLDVGGALKGGVSGYAAGKLGDALPGIMSAGKAGAAGGGGLLGGAKAVGKAVLPSALGGGSNGGILDTLNGLPGVSSALDFLKGNNGLNALGVGQGINAALLNKKALEYAKNAEGTAMGQWNQNAPLRDAGRAGMLAPKPSVDTSFLPGIRKAGNPFARVGG